MDENKIRGFFWKGDFDNYYLGHQFAEIYKDRIYKPYLEHLKDPVVIDIGANLGLFSLYASKYAKKVYAIEPAKEHFEMLQLMVRSNGLANVEVINKAIWIENKTMPFFHNKNKTMYSLHMAVNDGSSKEEPVEGTTFDSLFETYKIEHVDLMKLDVEGTEAELLASEGFSKVAPKINTVVLEVHSWNGRHPNQITDTLKNNGYKFIKQIPNDADVIVAMREEQKIL